MQQKNFYKIVEVFLLSMNTFIKTANRKNIRKALLK